MPKISEWGSISIFINTRGEHNPPHFHAMSAEWEASIRISDFGVIMRAGRALGKIGGLK
jgi:hypothetical protein